MTILLIACGYMVAGVMSQAALRGERQATLGQMESAGELQFVRGANREEEIGGIVDFYQRKTGNPAVLFDEIPGYASGHRVIANILTSTSRIKLTLGLPADATDMDLVAYWRRYMKDARMIPPLRSHGVSCGAASMRW